MSVPTLKRPRPSSQPPSPSSSSSPKRAASEDPYQSSSDSGRPENCNLLSPTMHAGGATSSPLRLESEPDEGGWVKRTEEVHLGSSDGRGGDGDGTNVGVEEINQREKLKAQYDILLAAVSPPFVPWETYYIIPSSILETIKTLALDPTSSKDGQSASSFRIDISGLVKDEPPQKVQMIQTQQFADGSTVPLAQAEEISVWSIKDGLIEDEDFMFISADGWNNLVEWYGPYDGPSLPRFCKPGGGFQMVPPIFTLYLVQRSSSGPPPTTDTVHAEGSRQPILFSCPTTTPCALFVRFVQSLLPSDLPTDFTLMRTWTMNMSTSPSSESSLEGLKSLQLPATLLPSLSGRLITPKPGVDKLPIDSVGIDNGDVIAIEIGKRSPLGDVVWAAEVDGLGKAVEKVASTIPVPTAPPPLFSKPAFFGSNSDASSSKAMTPSSSDAGMQTRSQSRTGHRRGHGLVGLVNLGNTCFMNSAVQCLSNTQELNQYFLSGVYRSELNPRNPLGMGGQIAEAFGGVIESLWAPTTHHSSFSPRQLKYTTSRFAPQFAGYGQHDTQEFIAFLLDGLHEDLNRIQKKPYIEKPDWKPGGGDKELAELGKECWDGYKKRNDSVIVDLFQGQLKSTLVCPECQKESITLDPFMYLTVPLPIAQTRVFTCRFVPLDTESPTVRVRLLIPHYASFIQVKEKLASLTKSKASHIVGFDLWKGSVYSWWLDSDHNGVAKDSDEAIFYELPVSVSSTRKAVGVSASEASITVPVYTFRTSEPSRSGYRNDVPTDCLRQPFFITLSKAEASDPVAVREAITKGYTRLVRPESCSELWVHSGSRRAAVALVSADEEEPVAEIHLEGDQACVVEVPSRSSEASMDIDGSEVPITAPQDSQINGSVAPLSDAGSIKSGKLVPRGDLFKVHVADAASSEGSSSFNLLKTKDPVVPFFKGNPSGSYTSWSRLENRRKARKNMFGQIATGFKSIVSGSTYASDDESSPPGTPVAPPLVVRPGEGIFCEWPIKTYLDFFDNRQEEETVVDPAIAKDLAMKKEGRAISLEDCLDEFSKEETLGQDDLWYCPQCKKHQAATKILEIYQAPDILVICIKRFGSSRRLSDKLDHLVNFPVDGLDLGERIGERKVAKSLQLTAEQAAEYGIEASNEPMLYDLYAVDNHFGGMGGGHYTAFCRNKDDGEWYNYDDSRVSRANVEAVQSRAAYLLFYRRRTTRPIGGISRIKAEEASRAASPMPPSPPLDPVAGPSTVTVMSRPSSPELTTTDTDELPSYSAGADSPETPPMPSPTLSSDDDRFVRDAFGQDGRTPDLSTIGAGLGCGNTAWGSAAGTTTGNNPGIRHDFGTQSTTPATTDTGSDMIRPRSPLSSDEDFEKKRTQSTENKVAEYGSGPVGGYGSGPVGGEFEVVSKDGTSEEETKMVSAPTSPE